LRTGRHRLRCHDAHLRARSCHRVIVGSAGAGRTRAKDSRGTAQQTPTVGTSPVEVLAHRAHRPWPRGPLRQAERSRLERPAAGAASVRAAPPRPRRRALRLGGDVHRLDPAGAAQVEALHVLAGAVVVPRGDTGAVGVAGRGEGGPVADHRRRQVIPFPRERYAELRQVRQVGGVAGGLREAAADPHPVTRAAARARASSARPSGRGRTDHGDRQRASRPAACPGR
jgi:hypothetical protein